MNILFALSPDFGASKTVHAIAVQLRLLGHNVDLISATKPGNEGARQLWADVVHFWGLNASNRFSTQETQKSARVVIHLDFVPHHNLAGHAVALTVASANLEEVAQPELPKITLWLGADPALFYSQPDPQDLRSKLRIPVNSSVVSYPGDVTEGNARDVRSLYLAVAMLNREGVPVTLVRAGRDHCAFLGPDEQWARKYSVELGVVNHAEVPHLLNLADYLIQPGVTFPTNGFWLPRKVAEFFAMGRPVILPRIGLGCVVQHGVNAWVLSKVDALGIVETIKLFRQDEALVVRLGEGAVEFYQQHFNPKAHAKKLEVFYRELLQDQTPTAPGPARLKRSFAPADSHSSPV